MAESDLKELEAVKVLEARKDRLFRWLEWFFRGPMFRTAAPIRRSLTGANLRSENGKNQGAYLCHPSNAARIRRMSRTQVASSKADISLVYIIQIMRHLRPAH